MEVKVESDKTKGKFYTVDTLKLTCDCPQFLYRGGVCKHIQKALGKLDNETTTKQTELI